MRVSAYTRTVNGQTVEVSGYDRADRPKLAAESKAAGTQPGGGSSKGKSGTATPTPDLPVSETRKQPSAASAETLRAAHPQSRLHTDLAEPPPFVKDLMRANPPATWEKMVLALENAGLGPNQVFSFATTFAAEGGVLKDRDSSASSGILLDTLREAQKAAPAASLLKSVNKSAELTLEQRAQVETFVADRALARVGGAIALEQIPDKQVAAAVYDTLFRHGDTGGTYVLQQAINRLRWESGLPGIKPDGMFADQTLASLVIFASPTTKQRLLENIRTARLEQTKGREESRMNFFATWN